MTICSSTSSQLLNTRNISSHFLPCNKMRLLPHIALWAARRSSSVAHTECKIRRRWASVGLCPSRDAARGQRWPAGIEAAMFTVVYVSTW